MTQRAVIYVRVSSTDQVKGYSLDVQERNCREWCKSHDAEVDSVFVDAGQSAQTTKRTQFKEMLKYIKENRSAVQIVLVDKVDRFSRSLKDGATLHFALEEWGIKLRSVKEHIDETPFGKANVGNMFVWAQLDNDMRRKSTTEGMEEALHSGRWTFRTPIGYMPGSKGKLVHDPVRAPIIAAMFQKAADGYALTDVVTWAKAQGLTGKMGGEITDSTASKLLRNELLKGWIEVPDFQVSRQADFEPIVTPELWNRVQRVLNGNSESLMVPHHRVNDKYPLKGVIVCGTCGKLANASTSRGRNGGLHAYYHCTRGRGHLSIRCDTAETLFLDVLERLQPAPARILVIEECFRAAWDTKNAGAIAERDRLERNLRSLRLRKTRIMADMETLTSADFKEMYTAVNRDIETAELELTGAGCEDLDVDTALGYLQHLLWNHHNYYLSSSLEGKRRISKLIFPDGIKCLKNGFGTAVTNSLFNMLGDESVPKNDLVALPGIEPGF